MLRRAVLFTLTLAISLAAACGRQVTPNPSTNNLSGKMVITFRTKGPMDFNNYNYVIVFNTCGFGGEPYPNAYATTFTNYSYAFAIGASYGGLTALPTLFQYILVAGTTNQLNPRPVPLGPSTTSLVYPYNGQTNQYQLTFIRSQLNNPLAVSNPCPNTSATPTPSPSPSPTPTATPTPGVGPTPTPSPSPTPSPTPTPNFNVTTWYVNFFTIDRTNVVQDSLGNGGSMDNSFSFTVNTTLGSQVPITRPAGVTNVPSNLAAYIDGGEVDNYP